MRDARNRSHDLTTQLTVMPWAAAHGRAERFWRALAETPGDADVDPDQRLWSMRAMQAAVTWLQADGVPTVTWQERGRRFLLARLAATRPAFDAQQRQALVMSVALDDDRPYPPVHPGRVGAQNAERLAMADGAATLARGGLLLHYALSAMGLLGRVDTARDLLMLVEARCPSQAPPPDGATVVTETDGRALLDVAACAVAEAGGVAIDIEGHAVVPVPVAQKAALWLRLRGRGMAMDPGFPRPGGATDNLLEALSRLRQAPRPLRVCAAAKAQVLAVADTVGVARGLPLRGLLNATTHAQAARRAGDMAAYFDALLHDTWTVTRLHAGGRPDAAGDDAWALLDCRLVPGRTTAAALAELREIVGDLVRIELLAERPGKESDMHAQLMRVLRQTLTARLPGAQVVPRLQLSGCDAWGWRQSAVPCLGFAPLQVPASVEMEALWQRGGVPTLAAERAWGRSVFVEAVARYLVEG